MVQAKFVEAASPLLKPANIWRFLIWRYYDMIDLERSKQVKFILKMPEDLGKLIGKISHFFSNINVAVIELSDILKTGDNIRIVGGTTDFTQAVDSMQIEHEKVEEAKPGDSVGLKVSEKVHEGYKVYKV